MDELPKREEGGHSDRPPEREETRVGGAPGEAFFDAADAIGDLAGEAILVNSEATKSLFWRLHGYAETHYFRASNGIQYTVFHNPTLKLFSGAHRSGQKSR